MPSRRNAHVATSASAPSSRFIGSNEERSDVFEALASADRLQVIRALCVAYRDSEGGDGALSITQIATRTEQSRFRASRNL